MVPFRRPGRWARGVHTSIRGNVTAYGYSILVTTVFGALQGLEGSPTVVHIFFYVGGACGAFAGLEAVVSRLFRRELEDEEELVIVLGGALNVFAVASGLAAAMGTALFLSGRPAWGVAPGLATIAYLLVSGLQMGVAEQAEEHRRKVPPPPEIGEGRSGRRYTNGAGH